MNNVRTIRLTGIASAAVGILTMLSGYMMSGAPEFSETLNVGLLNDKTNLVLIGGFLMSVGVMLFCTSELLGKIGDEK